MGHFLGVFWKKGKLTDVAPYESCPLLNKMGCREVTLILLDFLINGLITGPLVVMYWRGTWGIVDRYLLPNDKQKSLWASAGIATVPLLLFSLSQHKMKEYLRQENKLVWIFVYHLYTYVAGVCYVNLWRCVWVAWDHYTGTAMLSCVISTVIAVVVLCLLRSFKNIWAPPFVAALDTGPNFFTCTTRFNTQPSEKEKYFLDHMLSVNFLGSVNVFFWRGVWAFMDLYLFPKEKNKSAWSSLGIGYSGYIICMCLQYPIARASSSLDGHFWSKLLLEDVFFLFGNICTVAVWRGVWQALELYIWPDNPLLSQWLSHGVGIGGLMLLLNGNGILPRGCEVDGERPGGTGCIFPNYFLRYYFAKEQSEEISDADTEKQNGKIPQQDLNNGHAHVYDNEALDIENGSSVNKTEPDENETKKRQLQFTGDVTAL